MDEEEPSGGECPVFLTNMRLTDYKRGERPVFLTNMRVSESNNFIS